MKSVVVLLGFAASLTLASGAYAGPLTLTDVGSVDTLLYGTNIDNSQEEATLAALLGVSVDDVSLTKVDTTTSSWTAIDDGNTATDLWAFDFGAYGIIDPLAFILKLGNAEFTHYLYTNNAGLQYAVVDLAQINPGTNSQGKPTGQITIASVSHISVVPEPSSLSLLLSGLAGLGLASVRRFRMPAL